MKKYENFVKYFNTYPRTFALIIAVLLGVQLIGSIIAGVFSEGYSLTAASIVSQLIFLGLAVYVYTTQITLTRARIGKHLKKYAGGDSVKQEEMLQQIDTEIARPRYSDVANKKKYNNFMVTENWIVGTDGMMFMKANAVRIRDVVKVEKNIVNSYRAKSGTTNTYYYLNITDKSDYVYMFFLRGEDNLDAAYDFIMQIHG